MLRRGLGTITTAALIMASLSPARPATVQATPIGIPEPTFGMSEAAPPAPNPWHTAAPGFYYVDRSSPSATDHGNPYGTPALPRETIPARLPAGAVVELHGVYDWSHASPRAIEANGTPERPVFIRGGTPRPRVTRAWEVSGSHFVIEDVLFAFADRLRGALAFVGPLSDAALRRCEVTGNRDGGGIAVGGQAGAAVERLLIRHNLVHDNGDRQASYDQDVHGIAVGAHVSRLFVLDNELYRNSGDGIQINAGSRARQATTHHVYVGRNVAHHNKQTGFWAKQSTDVVFSQNLAHSHRPSDSSLGQCMGFQYAPERIWFIANHAHDCDFGIAASSDNDLGEGRSSYVIGNVIHGIHHTGSYNPETAWSSAAIMLAGGVDRHVIGNTIHDVDAGVNVPGSGAVEIANNVISGVGEPRGNHVFVEQPATAAGSSFHHNLIEGRGRIRWGGTTYELGALRQALPRLAEGCIEGIPAFVDPGSEDFRLTALSPALDAGIEHDAYARFGRLYGLALALDPSGIPRPQGRGWDIGAHERPALPDQLRRR